MEAIDYVKWNADAWTNVKEGLVKYGTAISHEKYMAAVNGELKVTLAGIKIVPQEWFPELKGADVLGLACGGGQQCPIFAAHGANVTVTDISEGQLANEKYVADREGYSINIVKADLSKEFPFADNSFDLIFNPVSNCYIEDISLMWKECARVPKQTYVVFETTHQKYPIKEYLDIRERLVSEWLPGSGYEFSEGSELTLVHWRTGEQKNQHLRHFL